MLGPHVANANIPAGLAELGLSLRQQNLAALMGNAGAEAGAGAGVGAVAVNPGVHAAPMPGPGNNGENEAALAAGIAAARQQFIQQLLAELYDRYAESDALHRRAIERLVQLDDYAAEQGGRFGPHADVAEEALTLRDHLQGLTATTGGPALVPAHRAEVEATLAEADAFLAEHNDVAVFPAYNRLIAMGANLEGQEEEVAAGNAEQAAIQAAINESAREAAERNRQEEEEAIAQVAAAEAAAERNRLARAEQEYRRRMANVAGRFGLAAPTVGTAGNAVPPQLPPNEVGAPVVVAPIVAPPAEMTPQERARLARLARFGGPPAPPKRKSRKARKAQKSRKGRKLARSRRA